MAMIRLHILVFSPDRFFFAQFARECNPIADRRDEGVHPNTAADSFRSIRSGLAKWSRGDLACLLYTNSPREFGILSIHHALKPVSVGPPSAS